MTKPPQVSGKQACSERSEPIVQALRKVGFPLNRPLTAGSRNYGEMG